MLRENRKMPESIPARAIAMKKRWAPRSAMIFAWGSATCHGERGDPERPLYAQDSLGEMLVEKPIL